MDDREKILQSLKELLEQLSAEQLRNVYIFLRQQIN